MSNCCTDFYNVWANLRLLPFSHICFLHESCSEQMSSYLGVGLHIPHVLRVLNLLFSSIYCAFLLHALIISSACLLTGLFLFTGSYLGKCFVNVFSLKSVESAENVNLK